MLLRLKPLGITILSIALILFVASHFMIISIEGTSMLPTLQEGQKVLILRGASNIKAGDIILFRNPVDNTLTVKRCIIGMDDAPVIVHGWLQTHWGNWFLNQPEWERLMATYEAAEDAFFVVGDNQFSSLDSRHYGYVNRRQIIGRLVVRN